MMLDSLSALVPRQQVFEIPAPARPIRPGSIAERGRGVQDLLDAPAQPNSGFPLLIPNRLEHAEHLPDVDTLHRQRQDRLAVGVDRGLPLLEMLGILPLVPVLVDVFLRDFSERLGLCQIERLPPALGVSRLDRVYAIGEQLARHPSPVPSAYAGKNPLPS